MRNDKVFIISIIIFLIIIIGVLLLIKGNDTNKKIDNKSDDNIKTQINNNDKNIDSNIFAIATKSDNKIYALTLDGSEIELFDISEYNGGVVYTYKSGKLYLYLYKYTSRIKSSDENILGYIDLTNDNYKFTKLTDIKINGSPSSIAVASNKIYFNSSVFDGIHQYNIDTNYLSISENITFDNKSGVNLYTISDDLIGYSISGTKDERPSIGLINVKSKTKKQILENAIFEYVYNENIIYKQCDNNDYSKWVYNEYNINDKSIKQISDITSSNQNIYKSFIVPFDNYYIYVNNNILYKYENNKSEKLLEVKDYIDNINLISKNEIYIIYRNNIYKYQYQILNLDDLKLSNSENENLDDLKLSNSENENLYSKVIYINK